MEDDSDSEPLLSSSSDFKTACGVLSGKPENAEVLTAQENVVGLPLSRDVSNDSVEEITDDDTDLPYDKFTNDNTSDIVMHSPTDDIAPSLPTAQVSTPEGANSGAVQALNSLVRDAESPVEVAVPCSSSVTSSRQGLVSSASSGANLYDINDDLTDGIFSKDDVTYLRAVVFVEDAIEYRSIHHRVDKQSLIFYRNYYSKPVQWLLYFIIFTLHMLVFLEWPSSLTATSDLRVVGQRVTLPCGVTESIEVVCLVILLADMICKSYLKGKAQFLKSKWLWASGIILVISLVDWTVSVALLCPQAVRIRRMLRPFFLLQNSSLMKKTVNCLRKTIPHVVSVLLLLFLHLYFFTLFGLLLFPNDQLNPGNSTHNSTNGADTESADYFSDPVTAFMSLLVLLTTANNPDVTLPAYSTHRLYAVFFILFLVIGLYCLMNMLTAVIYNQFRGYFSDSIQASLFRRRLAIKAAYEVLRRHQVELKFSSSFSTLSQGVSVECLSQLIRAAKIQDKYKRAIEQELNQLPGRLLGYDKIQQVFSVLDNDVRKNPRPNISEKHRRWTKILQKIVIHKAFNIFGCVVAGANVICITVELSLEKDHIRNSRNTYLGIFNLVFVVYFCVEQSLKMWALGWLRYSWDIGNLCDGVITILLLITEGVYVTIYGIPYWGEDHTADNGVTLWDLVRIINILIMVRLLRLIVSQIKAMSVVSTTLFDLIKNLRAFAGILVVIFYSYALLGMELFRGKVVYTPASNDTSLGPPAHSCGTYRQLQYWANNFDDFGAAIVVLWDVMVVNNWHVFLEEYSRVTNGWSRLYFIVWWLLSVVISLNLFTALILENFIMRWDKQLRRQTNNPLEESIAPNFDIHDLFRQELQEPSEESLTVELRHHPHFHAVT